MQKEKKEREELICTSCIFYQGDMIFGRHCTYRPFGGPREDNNCEFYQKCRGGSYAKK